MKKITFEDVLKKHKAIESRIYNYSEAEDTEEEDMGDDSSDGSADIEDVDLASLSAAEKASLIDELLDSCEDDKACVALAKKLKSKAEKVIAEKEDGGKKDKKKTSKKKEEDMGDDSDDMGDEY